MKNIMSTAKENTKIFCTKKRVVGAYYCKPLLY